MDGESGIESTEGEDVVETGKGKSESEIERQGRA